MPRYSYQWLMTVTVKAKHAVDRLDAENIAIEQRAAAIAAIKPDTRTVAIAGQVEPYKP